MSDIERKAKELLAYECPECGGENGHESEDGWLRCSRCSNPHDVTRHQAMQAIIAALTPPEGYVLVPVKITKEIKEVLNESFEYGYSAESTWDLAIHASSQEVK